MDEFLEKLSKPVSPQEFSLYHMTVTNMIQMADSPRAFAEYLESIVGRKEYEIEWDCLGFIEDYFWLSKLIPLDLVVVDVGCATGIQHTFFRHHKAYIGIDSDEKCPMKAFTQNAKFWISKFSDGVRKGILSQWRPEEMFGIDNMVLHYSTGNEKEVVLFDMTFSKKFVR